MSNLEDLISNDAELSSIIGHSPIDVRTALEHMAGRSIIKVSYGERSKPSRTQSVRLSMNWNLAKWKLMENSELKESDDHHEAIIFPIRPGLTAPLQILAGNQQRHGDKKAGKSSEEFSAWNRIFEAFAQNRDLDERESKSTEKVAKGLADAHPVDQILVLVRHFGARIPTLSLLASNWDHYAEQYEHEHQNLDLFEIQHKQQELNQKARDAAVQLLEKRKELELSEEEVLVLELLSQHRHPRRQLFWAYQQRIRYPKLANFFKENEGLMLAITQSGQIIKDKGHPS
jgi:hypothetical protein